MWNDEPDMLTVGVTAVQVVDILPGDDTFQQLGDHRQVCYRPMRLRIG